MASSSNKWKKAVLDFLSRQLNKWDLQKPRQEEESDRKLPILTVPSLNMAQVQRMLGLQLVINDPELDNVRSIRMPPELVNILTRIANLTSRSDASEATIRWTLNMLIVFAHDIVMSNKSISGQAIRVQTEKNWAYSPVKWHNKRYKLIGKPDYAIWYGEIEETALNIVIVEAKRRYSAPSGLVQCLAYMGIVHRLRKEAGKENCTVYGMASDDQEFIFLKINKNSEWSERNVTTRIQDYSLVLGLLIHFLRAALMISPTHSKQSSEQSHAKEKSDSTTPNTVLGARGITCPSMLLHSSTRS